VQVEVLKINIFSDESGDCLPFVLFHLKQISSAYAGICIYVPLR